MHGAAAPGCCQPCAGEDGAWAAVPTDRRALHRRCRRSPRGQDGAGRRQRCGTVVWAAWVHLSTGSLHVAVRGAVARRGCHVRAGQGFRGRAAHRGDATLRTAQVRCGRVVTHESRLAARHRVCPSNFQRTDVQFHLRRGRHDRSARPRPSRGHGRGGAFQPAGCAPPLALEGDRASAGRAGAVDGRAVARTGRRHVGPRRRARMLPRLDEFDGFCACFASHAPMRLPTPDTGGERHVFPWARRSRRSASWRWISTAE